VPRIHFGLEIPNTQPWEVLRAAALRADGQRWRTLWAYDHLLPCTAEELPLTVVSADECEAGPILEGWTLLAALAALTCRVRLGCMVSPASFRPPGLLAKMAVTVDHVSQGRVDLGLGAGWHEREHEAFGIPLGDLRERSDRLEEATQVLRQLLSGPGPSDFQGRFFRLVQAPFAPPPRQAHLPLLVAGGGEKRTLRTVARHADACNLYGNVFGSLSEVRHKLRVLDELCREAGRDPGQVRRTVTLYGDVVEDARRARELRAWLGQHLPDDEAEALPLGEPSRLIEAVEPYVALGVDEIVLNGPALDLEHLDRLDRLVLAAFD
jgi:alkanesulfonate monooxygenase SsuD/methylene tetrahydromethanopterin reductase-like flavin-dependent oxidoreductase (luciferase family)